MKLRPAVLLVALLVMATVVAGDRISLADEYLPEGAEFTEIVMVNVNCTTASVSVTSGVISNNTELVHFPSEINMNAIEWENVTQVMVGFSTDDSFLFYTFNNTTEDAAESNANTLTNQLNTVFGMSFSHNSTYISNSYVNVTYVGVGVGNLTQYTEWLTQECLASDLGGFSLTFIPMTNETDAYTAVGALKESGDFNWTYAMGVMYSTSIPEGLGYHTIDVLDLLSVESLAPSPNALTSIPEYPYPIYMSLVMLTITSNETITFVSCIPDQASPPQRGWYIYPQIWPTQLQGMFSFGGDSTPVTELSLTFSGVVIPEFATPMLLAVLASATTITVSLQKRFKRK
ncbi:MAG: hypothetical protein ACPL1Z_06940 [Candidatus Bathyarchaeales archaeon]